MGVKIPIKYQKLVDYQILLERRQSVKGIMDIVKKYEENPDVWTSEDLIKSMKNVIRGGE